MFLLLSEEADYSTVEVCRWLSYFYQKYLRVDYENTTNISEIRVANGGVDFRIELKGRVVQLLDIKGFWYRRGFLKNALILDNVTSETDCNNRMSKHLQAEYKDALEFITYKLVNLKSLGNPTVYKLNKLIVLEEAIKLNLKVPKTLICKEASSLDSFFNKQNDIITKSISDGLTCKYKTGTYTLYTEKVNQQLDLLEFNLTLFQEKIEKEADIRIFYTNGCCYSMAIMSQNNSQTETDFRKYDDINPNRKLSFKLPIDIENKIKKLMGLLKLDSGSIDMIFTKSGDFIFLEINPVGQFGMTSYPCNYFLEKNIAHFFTT
jgi:ATP-GRASP peptide maturase of grasp-with-spasm system